MLVESMLKAKEFFQKWYLQAVQYSSQDHFVKSEDGGCSGSGSSSSMTVESSCWLAHRAVMKLDTPTSPSRIAPLSPDTKKANGSIFQVASAPRGHSNLSI